MSVGIYKYENKLNGKIYIGLSRNIERRYAQHIYDATRLKKNKSTGIDYAINKYGIENFNFEIIELCDESQLNEKERYWINHYNSYKDGYNRTVGGESLSGEEHPRAVLTEKEVWDIREQYGQGIPRREVFKPYLDKGITERCLIKVWNCENWTNIHNDVYTKENKEIHKKNIGHSKDQIGLSSIDRAIKQTEINQWIKEYQNGMSINAIAKKYKRDHGTVEKYINHPVEIKKIKYKGRKVKNIETNIIFDSISAAAKWAGCGSTTLTRHLTTDCIAGKVPETQELAHWEEIL